MDKSKSKRSLLQLFPKNQNAHAPKSPQIIASSVVRKQRWTFTTPMKNQNIYIIIIYIILAG